MISTLHATMREFYRREAPASPGGRAVELPGVTAFVTPSAPAQSIVNGVLFDDADALAAARDELDAIYAVAGVTHWMVWTMPGDSAGPAVLRAGGHAIEYEPLGMALALTDLRTPEPTTVAVEVDRDPHPLEITTLNERANGEPPGTFGTAFAGLRDAAFHRYLARVDGRPAACLVTFDHARDCIVNWVATDPDRQRRGIGRALLHVALADARRRGARTATLQSSYEGERLYRSLGFTPLGRLGMWLCPGAAAALP